MLKRSTAMRPVRQVQSAGGPTRNPHERWSLCQLVSTATMVRHDTWVEVALICYQATVRVARTTCEATLTSRGVTLEHQTDAPEAASTTLSTGTTRVEASVLRKPVTLIRLISWR